MNEQMELAIAMLAVTVSAVLLVAGSFYLDRLTTPEASSTGAALTRQADAEEGLDLRQINERNLYIRSER